MYLLDYNMSVAVGVGFIALAGLSAELGVVMLTYLDNSFNAKKSEGRMRSQDDLNQAVIEGAALRLRPILMTVCSTIGGLLPIMWGHGAGSEVMQRIAAPMVGGLISSTILALLVIPAIYALWKSRGLKKQE